MIYKDKRCRREKFEISGVLILDCEGVEGASGTFFFISEAIMMDCEGVERATGAKTM